MGTVERTPEEKVVDENLYIVETLGNALEDHLKEKRLSKMVYYPDGREICLEYASAAIVSGIKEGVIRFIEEDRKKMDSRFGIDLRGGLIGVQVDHRLLVRLWNGSETDEDFSDIMKAFGEIDYEYRKI
jgi:hypothetical protein